ncbi:hypothetical protein [Dyadobacter psychrophilus]|uniref:hypothetical protein n=1 Tax=Dyadobacter psychrophilus TaxID=651661 RepID=UPI0011324A91|nr:hypothetical protein [Dyadobacter psychrophilus]
MQKSRISSIIETRVPERHLGKFLPEVDLTNPYNVIVLAVPTLSKESENGLTKLSKRLPHRYTQHGYARK